MIILENLKGLIIKVARTIVLFFTEVKPSKRQAFSRLDLAEIFLSLLPAAVFGCLVFGVRALITLLLCMAVCTLVTFLWDVIFNRQNLSIDYKAALMGFILGLTLTSGIKLPYIIAISVFATLVAVIFFRGKPLSLVYPVLIARVIFSVFFFKALAVYPLPFEAATATTTPLSYIFNTYSFTFAAKDLFFGLHGGNIGQISDCLLIVGGVYLMLRKLVNPIICGFYLATSILLSYLFHQSLTLSLFGGGLFFAVLFLTVDYGLMATPLYKKILYGVSCGVLTFLIRLILRAEGAVLAVLVCNLFFTYFTRRNIKRAVKFLRNPDFKKLLNKTIGVLKV